MRYSRVPDRSRGLRLHLNENTAGCSPAVLAALQSIEREQTAFYPDYRPMTRESEEWFGVEPGWVQLINGLDEGLHLVAQHAAHQGTPRFEAVVLEPAFEMYAACAEAAGGVVTCVPPAANFAFSMAALRAAVTERTRLIYVTDPNNPTGLAMPAGSLEAIAREWPEVLVLVDEAYAEFSGRTVIGPLLDRFRNLVTGRTFAKAHGLAALRVGALVAHPDTLEPLRRLQPPYSVNICALIALRAALRDRAYLEWSVAQAAASKALIYQFCERHGLHCWPSEANFVLVRLGPDATAIVKALADNGVLIRDRSTQPGCMGCVRITAGVEAHTARGLAALEETLAARKR